MGGAVHKPENKYRVGLPSTDPAVAPKLNAKAKQIIQRFKDVSDDHVDIMTLRGQDIKDLASMILIYEDYYRDIHMKVPLTTFVEQNKAGLANNVKDASPDIAALVHAYYTKDFNKPTPSPSNISSIGSYMPANSPFSSFFKS